MRPRVDLASTGYALASPGRQDVVLQPAEAADTFTVRLDPGDYTGEWFSVIERRSCAAAPVAAKRAGAIEFRSPFDAGPAVLHLRSEDA